MGSQAGSIYMYLLVSISIKYFFIKDVFIRYFAVCCPVTYREIQLTYSTFARYTGGYS